MEWMPAEVTECIREGVGELGMVFLRSTFLNVFIPEKLDLSKTSRNVPPRSIWNYFFRNIKSFFKATQCRKSSVATKALEEVLEFGLSL